MTRGPSAGPSFRESRPALDRAVYEARTGEILVRVEPRFLPEQSDERERRYVWAYTVEIENHGEETVQLLSRRWLITDALNRTEPPTISRTLRRAVEALVPCSLSVTGVARSMPAASSAL
jgi:hypothetical protein